LGPFTAAGQKIDPGNSTASGAFIEYYSHRLSQRFLTNHFNPNSK